MALLEERTMLACLHIGTWSGMIRDKEVSDEVAESHHAELDAGLYSKRLVTAKHLHVVRSKYSALGTVHRAMTLPWEDGGVRILATKSFFTYTERMRLGQHACEAAKIQFQQQLPDIIEQRKEELG